MPESSRRSVPGGGQGRRREAARPARRGRSRPTRKLARRVSWSRRIGASAALVLLAGAGMAFAGGAFDNHDERRSPEPTVAPLLAPTLFAPAATLTSASTTDVSGHLPEGVREGAAYTLRIYVNDELVRERTAPADPEFTIKDIPLGPGDNQIAAALATLDREGDRSVAVTVTRDDEAPVIRISRPAAGAPVYSAAETIRGRTEAGADVEIIVEQTGETITSTIAADGRFEAPVTLEMGDNTFVLRSADPAGNRATATLVVTRMLSLASIEMSASASELTLADLPATVAVVAEVRDEVGAAAEGADVTFSVSPPNRTTTTYRTIATGGIARWPALTITGDRRAVGTWLVTVLVLLPSGEELREDVSIVVAE